MKAMDRLKAMAADAVATEDDDTDEDMGVVVLALLPSGDIEIPSDLPDAIARRVLHTVAGVIT